MSFNQVPDSSSNQGYFNADHKRPMPNWNDLGISLGAGKIKDFSVVRKFGLNESVGTSFVPVAIGGIFQTPQVAGATTLRVAAGGNANDTALGSGARKVYLQGLNASGVLINESLATAGASASAATSQSFMRLFRFFVEESGTYGSASAGSHAGSIAIENGAGGTTWGIINFNGFPMGQSEVGVYTVPLGYTAFMVNLVVTVESNKAVDVICLKRENILETAAPYSPIRQVLRFPGLTEWVKVDIPTTEPFPALTDIGFMAKVATGTAAVSVRFEIVLVKT